MRFVQLSLLIGMVASLTSGCQMANLHSKEDLNSAHMLFAQSPASADAIFDSAVAQNQGLWQRISDNITMHNVEHARIDRFVKNYTRTNYMEQVSARAKPYLFHIVEALEAADMPIELAFVPVIESTFDPFAYSHGRAAGMWQFVPETGRHLGLQQNWWYDGRRDVIASTEAAIKYFKYLHKRFDNDWLLALAAYNTGEGNLNKAIRRNRKANKPTDFWSLKLHKETSEYVAKILAITRIVKTPEAHKVALAPIGNRPYFVKVDIAEPIDLAEAATLADTDLDDFYRLNPAFKNWTTAPQSSHSLLVPAQKAVLFKHNLAELEPSDRKAWQRYTVKAGDSLGVIAARFNSTTKRIKSTNHLSSNVIRIGQTLMIPSKTLPDNYLAFNGENPQGSTPPQKVQHTVKNGDSLWKIARQYDVSLKNLTQWNQVSSQSTLQVGKQLTVWVQTLGR